MSFQDLWSSLLPLGRDERTGGYHRFSWTPADEACRAWFTKAAAERGLRTQADHNGNLWAWWDTPTSPSPGAVVTGSHLDSVPGGGAFDGALGVASAFAAVDTLRERGCTPVRPLAIAAFCEEEGARFGVACLGSRLAVGTIDPQTARALRDASGASLAQVMASAGHDPALIGPDEELLSRVSAYVELHIEQGRGLVDLGAQVGVAEGIWPHGRWRLTFTGRADHAGTAVLADRRDPMLPAAAAVLAAREVARAQQALATVGKLSTEPGAANAVASRVTVWLDARAPDGTALQTLAAEILSATHAAAQEHGVDLDVSQESVTPAVVFDAGLRESVTACLAARGVRAPALPTGAGHDAGVFAARVPTAMIFVRNPTGVSHSPAEYADMADCEAGVAALAAVLEDLACW
ncbi:MAG TPA: allantoate amidohydrolase [Streptosporangiaceae bacterium]|nr:allantoate amidohydrolase [Streptosporangiaceae bacterium]